MSKLNHNRNICIGDTNKNKASSYTDIRARMAGWDSAFLSKVAIENKNETWREAATSILRQRGVAVGSKPQKKKPKKRHKRKAPKLTLEQKIGSDAVKAMQSSYRALNTKSASARWGID